MRLLYIFFPAVSRRHIVETPFPPISRFALSYLSLVFHFARGTGHTDKCWTKMVRSVARVPAMREEIGRAPTRRASPGALRRAKKAGKPPRGRRAHTGGIRAKAIKVYSSYLPGRKFHYGVLFGVAGEPGQRYLVAGLVFRQFARHSPQVTHHGVVHPYQQIAGLEVRG